jgi:hypothetical protein
MEARRPNGVASDERGMFSGPALPTRASADPKSRPEQAGFAGTYCTTLLDWIQMVQMGRRDAVLTVRSPDGGEAMVWFKNGDIIDAVCDGLSGKEAVYRVIAWRTGEVSLSFNSTNRPRKIEASTSGILLEALARKDEAERAAAESGGLNAAPLPGRGRGPRWGRISPMGAAAAAAGATLLLLCVMVARRAPPPSPLRSSRLAPSAPAPMSVLPLDSPSVNAVGNRVALAGRGSSVPGSASSAVRPSLSNPASTAGASSIKRRRTSAPSERPPAPDPGMATTRSPSIRVLDQPSAIRIIGQPEAHIDVLE